MRRERAVLVHDVLLAACRSTRFCAAGLLAVSLAAQRVRSGWEQLVIGAAGAAPPP
jgi:acetyl-CoA acetyltransferase